MTRALLLVGAARTVSLVLGLVLLSVLGRRLGPDGFGSLQFALAVMAYPTLLVDLGLTTLGLREIASGAAAAPVIRRVLGARLMLSFGAMSAVLLGVAVVPMDEVSRLILVILALGLPASALNARWVLQGERRFAGVAVVEVIAAASQLAGALLLVRTGSDAALAAAAFTLAGWTVAVVTIVVAGGSGRFRPEIGRGVRTTILRSLPLGAAAIAIAIYYSIDTVLIGVFRSSAEVAYYAAAYRIILPVLALASAVATVAIPHLSRLAASDAPAAERETAGLARLLVLAALPIAVGGALTAEPIINAVYGAEFAPAVGPFRILVWSVATVFGNAAFAFLLLARHGDRRYLAATAAGAFLNVALNLVAIPAAGIMGAAVVTMISELSVLGLILYWTGDVSRIGVPAALRGAAVPILALCVAVWPIRESALAIPLGAVVYGLVAGLTGALPIGRILRRSRPTLT